MKGLVSRLLGHDRERRRLAGIVARVNALETLTAALDERALAARTEAFRTRLAAGESLDALLPEAFATVREAARRVLGQRHYDVQVMGGAVLHAGRIAEMRTGEGKTLVATLPTYLNALTGKGVHVVTVNDYLARRDAEANGRLLRFLGLSVGCVVNGMPDEERRVAYSCDVTYGTNSEFGFDYLRDNMKGHPDDKVQRPFSYAIVDEVDSILIDEARTPLIISGRSEDSSGLYLLLDRVIPELRRQDYEIDEKFNTVSLKDSGIECVESRLREVGVLRRGGLYDPENLNLVHHVQQALRAHTLYRRDKDYIVRDGRVVLVDEFTGRALDGRRFADGLHQALEAKEGVEIQEESRTLASITYQNFFRMYPKLSGMTGTALSDAEEFLHTYRLEVTAVPTHCPVVRRDHDDVVYATELEKFAAVAEEIQRRRAAGQPVLVGTGSIEKSERLSALLSARGVAHTVLNARHHEQEARIVAQAGRLGAVTISTNMAGRGTDILLGGNLAFRLADEVPADLPPPEREALEALIRLEVETERQAVLRAGGLFVIGTERHESRRIDDQLRGRSGRQGDPGESRFFVSLEDDLMRNFGTDRMKTLVGRLGHAPDEAIQHPWLTRAITRAQRRLEERNLEQRKNLLKYDDVVNEQRKAVYGFRDEILTEETPEAIAAALRVDVVRTTVERHAPEESFREAWNVEAIEKAAQRLLALDAPVCAWADEEGIGPKGIAQRLEALAAEATSAQAALFDPEAYQEMVRGALLAALDAAWQNHLSEVEALRHGIGLRAYGQREPLTEFKVDAFAMFGRLMDRFRDDAVTLVSHALPPDVDPALLGDRFRTADLRLEPMSSTEPCAASEWSA